MIKNVFILLLNITFFFAGFNLLFNCSTTHSVVNNYESNRALMFHPDFVIYHQEHMLSTLFFQINTDEVLYTRSGRDQPFVAKLKLEYTIYEDGKKHLIDSGSLFIKDVYQDQKNFHINGENIFKFSNGTKGNMELKLTDLNRSREFKKHILIDKQVLSNIQFFHLQDSMGYTRFDHHFFNGQLIYITSDLNSNKLLYALRNNTVFPLASPPFSKSASKTFPKKTTFADHLVFADQNTLSYQLPSEGFVHFQLDTLNDNGFTIFNFHDKYPYIKTTEHMISPVRYLCSRKEYESLRSMENPKDAIDEFWLSKTTSSERARELIRRYYSRVQLANEVFSSYVEGWMTDRGLVSIIFGPPKLVRRGKGTEIWIYGDETNMNTLKFTFSKVDNPFSANDYELKRNYSYKSSWYRAVDTWRNGRVYWEQ